MTGTRLFPRRDRRFAAWKNGGGQTAEVLVHPEGAGFDAFDWRISTAVVAASGPFSMFPGVDRVLTALEGGPMRLRIDGTEDHVVEPGAPPLAFAGDRPCTAELLGPALLDLNVMVRRPLRARVTRDLGPGPGAILARYLFADAGIPELGLEKHDLLALRADASAPIAAAIAGRAWMIEIGR